MVVPFTFGVSMKCDSCDQKATVFYTQVTDGKMKKTALCEACADQQGVTDPTGLLMAEQLMGKVSSSESPFPQAADAEVQSLQGSSKCPACGFTIADYQKIGRLGCGDCYRAFHPDISQRLPSLHKGLAHSGRIPSGMVELELKQSQESELKQKMDRAIAEENYEEAAKLRDDLQDITEAGEGQS